MPHILRLLTINTHKGFSSFNRRFVLRQLREAIRETEADIVFLQEVVGEHTGKARKHRDWPAESQYVFLAESVWTEYAYGKNAIYPAGHHGNAILSRYPIENFEKVDISTNKIEQRGFLSCMIRIPKERSPLYCICVHLGLFGISRKKQLAMLKKYISEKIPPDAPLVIGGDFNDWRAKTDHYLARPLGLREAFIETEGRLARTFPAWMPILRLDRFYVRGLELKSARGFYRGPLPKLSDHVALFMEVSFSRKRGGSRVSKRRT